MSVEMGAFHVERSGGSDKIEEGGVVEGEEGTETPIDKTDKPHCIVVEKRRFSRGCLLRDHRWTVVKKKHTDKRKGRARN